MDWNRIFNLLTRTEGGTVFITVLFIFTVILIIVGVGLTLEAGKWVLTAHYKHKTELLEHEQAKLALEARKVKALETLVAKIETADSHITEGELSQRILDTSRAAVDQAREVVAAEIAEEAVRSGR
jgi:DNA phosphorothioation-dependent restriction protein DptG